MLAGAMAYLNMTVVTTGGQILADLRSPLPLGDAEARIEPPGRFFAANRLAGVPAAGGHRRVG